MRIDVTIVDADLGVTIDSQRAQIALEARVMQDMVPLMPIRTGSLRQRTQAQSSAMLGAGYVMAAAGPYGRFQYYGKVMVDPETGSPWARPGAKKVLTDRDLVYSDPSAVPRWFEAAKAQHLAEWTELVKREVLNNG